MFRFISFKEEDIQGFYLHFSLSWNTRY